MGNAPLHSPPPASSRRSVLVITTNHKFGTSLILLEESSSSSRQTLPADVTEQQQQQQQQNRVLPFAFAGGPISTEEYFEKLNALRERLGQWKGGLYTLILVAYSIVMISAFVIVYFIPQFWTSPFFDHPGYLFAAIGFQLGLLIGLIAGTKYEFQSLQKDIEEGEALYGPWRARGVRVHMKRVATIGKDREVQRRRQNKKAPSGYNCFCIIMDINRGDDDEEQQQNDDNGSVATVQTLGEDSVHEDGDHQDD